MATASNSTRRVASEGNPVSALAFSMPSALAGDDPLDQRIERHRENYAQWSALIPFTDDVDERYDPAAVSQAAKMARLNRKLLNAIVHQPVAVLPSVQTKARYLAALDEEGALDYEVARAFLHSVANGRVAA